MHSAKRACTHACSSRKRSGAGSPVARTLPRPLQNLKKLGCGMVFKPHWCFLEQMLVMFKRANGIIFNRHGPLKLLNRLTARWNKSRPSPVPSPAQSPAQPSPPSPAQHTASQPAQPAQPAQPSTQPHIQNVVPKTNCPKLSPKTFRSKLSPKTFLAPKPLTISINPYTLPPGAC